LANSQGPSARPHGPQLITLYDSVARPIAKLHPATDWDAVTFGPHAEGDDKGAFKLWSPGVVATGTDRSNEAVQYVSAWVADLDKMTAAEVQTTLDTVRMFGIRFAAYTTHTHMQPDPKAKGAIGPKWRLVIPYAVPIAVEAHTHVWHALKDLFAPKLDPQCKDCSRQYYIPSCRVGAERELIELDPTCPLFDVSPIAESAPDPEAERPREHLNLSRVLTDAQRAAAVDAIANYYPEQGRNELALALGGAFAIEGVRTEDVEFCVGYGAAAGGALEPNKHANSAVYSAINRAEGGETKGWPTVAELLGEHGAAALRGAIQSRIYVADKVAMLKFPKSTPAVQKVNGVPAPAEDPDDPAAAYWEAQRLPENITDAGLADQLAEMHAHRLRWCEARKAWFGWNGRRWVAEDGTAQATQLVFNLSREIQNLALQIDDHDRRKRVLGQAMAYEGAKHAAGALTALRTFPEMRVRAPDLDRDDHLLNCENGVVDLRTGDVATHDPALLMTKCTGVDYVPGARSELWEGYLEDLTGGDAGLRGYLQRAAGMSLWGYPVEKAFFFLWGVPDSGKSRFLDALRAALGSYAAVAGFDTWLQRNQAGGNRGDLVSLAGCRLVVSSEVRPNAKLDSELVKAVTGGDTLKHSAKYLDEIEFKPTFTLWWAANDRPRVRADDSGFWSRARVVGCQTAVPKERQNKRLAELWERPEHAQAILAWLVKGCLAWRSQGLGSCPAVEAEIKAYRESQDPTAEFWSDCGVEAAPAGSFVLRTSLWERWRDWAQSNGGDATRFIQRSDLFQKACERFGATEGAIRGKRGFKGLQIMCGVNA
jgi:putative DNA primase/helicase